ncbi:ATP-dependent Clp protease proteolytic subunit [bioreactor metagenome]|uniref:ATP-dependent Clp protease proteolytic subunit n=1 Tax=bioreactor metagenome TaxID=1076179 RepID=A0A645BUH1_9ZZZZ
MSFYRFVRMEAEKTTHLYIEGVMEAQRPWWMEDGEVCCPEDFRAALMAAGNDRVIVHVNSPGGDVTAGIAIFEMLRQRSGETRCEVTFAASAASLIPCAISKPNCLISPAGMVMIHNPSMIAYGDESEMERAKAALKAWKQAAIGAYRERIDKTDDEIAALMSQEVFLPAKEAVELGICDAIMQKPAELGASMYYRQAVMTAESNSLAHMIRHVQETSEAKEREELLAFAKS